MPDKPTVERFHMGAVARGWRTLGLVLMAWVWSSYATGGPQALGVTPGRDLPLLVILALLTVALAYGFVTAWTWRISVDAEALTERSCFGLRTRRLPFAQVSEARLWGTRGTNILKASGGRPNRFLTISAGRGRGLTCAVGDISGGARLLELLIARTGLTPAKNGSETWRRRVTGRLPPASSVAVPTRPT